MADSVAGTLKLDADDMLALSRDFRAEGRRMVYRGHPRGTSMWPIIRSGDGIVVEQIPEELIRVHDVLVFSTGGEKLIAHRLVRKEGVPGQFRYIFRGDFRRYLDKPVYFPSIVGKVVAIERRGKTIRTDSVCHRLGVGLWRWASPFPLLAWSIWRRLRPCCKPER